MIKIEGVQPTASELRPLTRGCGAVHWVTCLPVVVPGVGLSILTFIGAAWDRADVGLADALATVLVLTALLWGGAQFLSRTVIQRAQRSAPGSGQPCDWTFDEASVEFVGRLSSSRVDWEAIKGVREEKDRIVLLITPFNNPVLPRRQLSEERLAALRALIGNVRAAGRLGRGVD